MADIKYKILCVDDEPELLELMKISLESAGFEVYTASGVDEALPILRANADRLALVISDFAMPGKTGFQFRAEMGEDYRHIPFVVVSGHITRESALEAIDLKIAGFLSKPYLDDEFLAMVETQSKDRITSIQEDEELRGAFLTDAVQLVDEMESAVLKLEEDTTQTDLLNQVFACAHTIKGTSGFFKPDIVHKFTHRYEDFLSQFKKGTRQLDSDSVHVLLQGLDILKSLLRSMENPALGFQPLEELVTIFDVAAVKAEVAPAAAANAPAKVATDHGSAPIDELRIGIPVLNEFMEKSGEITVLRNMVNKVFNAIEAAHEDDPNVSVLSDLMAEMHKAIGTMQEQITELKKVSVAKSVKPLFRSLRDLTVSLKKDIRLDVRGDDLRVDHGLADVFNKCLIHLLRNSADHGLESGAERVKAGKPEHGTIHLHISETQDEVIVEMGDDGRGIDASRIARKAIEKNVVTAERAAQMSEADIRLLIFEPSFSTSEQVTDVSGRGVGMDMVKQVVSKVGGRIELKSAVGSGTTFRLRLPIPKSVLIISSLMVKSGAHTFAIPQDNVDRVVALDEANRERGLKHVGGRLFYLHSSSTDESDAGGVLNPIFNLAEILDPATRGELPEGGFLVRVRGQQGAFFLRVDQVLETEDIVVKPVAGWFGALRVYKGATFLGDGRIGLILDVDGIAETHNVRSAEPSSRAVAEEGAPIVREQFLTFRLGDRSVYALPRGEVIRIEKLRASEIVKTGRQDTIIYRGHAIPLLHLAEVLGVGVGSGASGVGSVFGSGPGVGSADGPGGAGDLDVIVVGGPGERLIGYVVGAVEDLVETERLASEVVELSETGHEVRIIHDRVVTCLRADGILRRVAGEERAA